jgi:hypothetical protein
MSTKVQIIFSAGRQFYAVPDIKRECGLWLSVETRPLPVPSEYHRPHSVCACVIPGRDYFRIGVFAPQHPDGSKALPIDDALITDYRDAAWWTPGLEEAWVELQRLREALAEATRLHVCEQAPLRHPERSEGPTRSDSKPESKRKNG